MEGVKFFEIAEFRNGLNFSSASHGKGCLIIGVSDFQNRLSPDYSSLSEINPDGIAKEEDYLENGDIIFVRSNGNRKLVGRSLFVNKTVKALFSGFCIRARIVSQKMRPLFCAYFSKTDQFRVQISSGSGGTNIQNLSQGILGNVIIPCPSLEVQDKIVKILENLDRKIELNNKINAELEAMAKTLYDYWFVQFDFPDENGKPYKSSGGKMVWNEDLKRRIPADWTALPLKELVTNCSNSISALEIDENTPYTPIDFLPMKKMSFGPHLSSEEAKTSLIKYEKDDILIGAMRVYFHRVCIAPYGGVTRTTTLVLKPKNEQHLPYLYQVCNEDRLIATADKLSNGTQQPYVNWEKSLEDYMVQYPNDVVLVKKYSSIFGDLVKNVINREIQNSELIKLRDWLLPMLMNGQIKVE